LKTQLDQQVTEFRAADVAIQAMNESTAGLVITDIENKKEVAAVVEGHRMVKAYRVKISKRGKELRAPATAFGKEVLKEEKRLLGLIEPIETRLDNEREKLRAAERAAAEAEKKAAAEKLQGRIDAMNAVGGPVNLDMLANITDHAFELELRAAKEAEADRVAEQHRIEKEREAAAEAEQAERRAADAEREAAERLKEEQRQSDLRAAMERAEALRAESDRLVDKNRVQQAELERLKQAEAQRVASERPAVVADAIVTVGKAIDTRVVEAELANSALRFPSAATRDMVDVDDHRTRLRAMVEPDQETWDLSPNDTAAIQWALDRIAELEASA
jgi:hypothetical protein